MTGPVEKHEARAHAALLALEDSAAAMRTALNDLHAARLQDAPRDPGAMFGDFRLGTRSLQRLEGVHPDILAVTHYAIRVSTVDFGITRTGGLRNVETQRRLMSTGASKTLRSRHLSGHAVDVAPLGPDGKYSRAPVHAMAIHAAFVAAGEELEVPLRWGGNWDGDGEIRERGESDLVHHELPRGEYGGNQHSQSKRAAAFLAKVERGELS